MTVCVYLRVWTIVKLMWLAKCFWAKQKNFIFSLSCFFYCTCSLRRVSYLEQAHHGTVLWIKLRSLFMYSPANVTIKVLNPALYLLQLVQTVCLACNQNLWMEDFFKALDYFSKMYSVSTHWTMFFDTSCYPSPPPNLVCPVYQWA